MVKENIKTQAEYCAQLPYTIVIEREDDQDVYYVARILELDGLLMTGDTPEQAVAELEAVKKEWIESYLELGNKMPKPLKSRKYSGQYRIRMEPSLHESLSMLAELEGISLNQFMVTRLARATGEKIYEEIDKSKNKLMINDSGEYYDTGKYIRESTPYKDDKIEKRKLQTLKNLLKSINDEILDLDL
jgi:antitoxin HicB